MTPTPPSTGCSTGSYSPDNQYRVVRKRNRVPLSCAPCRNKKLKCNRSNPCENCIRRGDAAGCSYAAPGPRRKGQSTASSSPDDMQQRIDRLEGLVLSLMTNGAGTAGPAAAVAAIARSESGSGPVAGTGDDDEMVKMEGREGEDSEVDAVSNSFGVLKVDNEAEKSFYIGDNDWHMVLADIAEVRNFFLNHKREIDAQWTKVSEAVPVRTGPAFLFNAHMPASDAELRAALPPRSKIEKLVSRFFNSLDPAVQVLHYKTFHDRMNAYFVDPKSQSTAWVGLLYATITLAMQSYSKVGDEPPEWKGRTREMAAEFRLRTVQALVACDYTKPNMYTIETLVLYVHGEYSNRMEVDMGLWLVIGMVVRLAMRMGYHRDAEQFNNLTPYQAEMRRRVWLFVRQCDILFSSQLALPNMVKPWDCDTQFPRNLFDDEFTIESKELPPARPDNEATPMSYILSKARLAYMLGDIIEDTQAINGRPVTYDDIMQKDQKLRDVQASIPPHLQLKPLSDSVLDPSSLLMQRYYLDILYQKSLCVLHRRYISRAPSNPRYAHSRRTAVEASMQLLSIQELLHRECEPGGRLNQMMWFVTSLHKSDFLLGAMIVCLDLNYDATAAQYDRFFWTPEQRANMLRALETGLAIWERDAGVSMEAFKAAKILRIMLEKLRSQRDALPPQSTADAFALFDEEQQEHSAAMTLGMLSSGGLTPNTAAMFAGVGVGPMTTTPGRVDTAMGEGGGYVDGTAVNGGGPASPFSQIFGAGAAASITDLPENLDWAAWDQYIQNGNAFDASLQYFPGQFDAATPGVPADLQMEQGGAYGNSVFMGANTPGRQ